MLFMLYCALTVSWSSSVDHCAVSATCCYFTAFRVTTSKELDVQCVTEYKILFFQGYGCETRQKC